MEKIQQNIKVMCEFCKGQGCPKCNNGFHNEINSIIIIKKNGKSYAFDSDNAGA